MTTISIIIPAYNGSRFIGEAIQSVSLQTYTDWELVIVDDGSTDSTQTIIQQFVGRDPERIRCVVQENQGVAAARNRGLRETTSPFVVLLDQDDIFFPSKLSLQIAQFHRNPSLGIVHSGWQVVDVQGNAIANIEPWQQALKLDVVQWVEWKPVFLGAMMFRRALIESVGGFHTKWKQTDDIDLVLRIARQRCSSVWLPDVTVQYRQHENNTSRNVHQQVEELEQVLTEFFQGTAEDLDIRKLQARSRFQSLVWSAWQLYRYGYMDDALMYLSKSLHFTPFLKSETILHWVEQFSIYSYQYGTMPNIKEMTRSPGWRDLVASTLLK